LAASAIDEPDFTYRSGTDTWVPGLASPTGQQLELRAHRIKKLETVARVDRRMNEQMLNVVVQFAIQSVVRALSEASPLDASELARRAALLPPSLSRIVRAMEERRLIKRGKPEGDARRVLFSITPAGQALIKAVSPEREEIYRSIEQHFGPAELQRLLDMLDRLIERMEEA